MAVKQLSLNSLVGLPVSHVWFGHGSALFLELGPLSESRLQDGSLANPKGSVTVMADFGWRIEKPRSIACGSGDSKARCTAVARKLVGAMIADAQVVGRIPELYLEFSSGLWLQTFSHYQGQPTWTIFFNARGCGSLCVKAGQLRLDKRRD
ncbi:MAG TPA: hypothetical protein PKN13_11795 [Accumulibacter sp.]|nr:hypothetical protein [Accumulibacter sp.]HMW17907.1 hypothetical protein [Accumulibacter sp.]HMX23182.1 hypothetical protein [Accumulibacter sp.]HNC16786.1 hypothetical protein [Accumulibacter sp.]HND80504.1 hypothetical protein [Accumulibacter sp.]